jgi:hypothetical protein
LRAPLGPASIAATSGVSVDSHGGDGALGGGNGGGVTIIGSTVTLDGAIHGFGGAATGTSPAAAGGAGGRFRSRRPRAGSASAPTASRSRLRRRVETP